MPLTTSLTYTFDPKAIEALTVLKKHPDKWVVLDTETTGVGDTDEIINIAVIDGNFDPIFNSFVKPTIPVSENAAAIHGITNEMLEDAPSFSDVWQKLYPLVQKKQVLIYNAQFDLKRLVYCIEHAGLESPVLNAHCLHLLAKRVTSCEKFFLPLQSITPFEIGPLALDKCQAVSFLLATFWSKLPS